MFNPEDGSGQIRSLWNSAYFPSLTHLASVKAIKLLSSNFSKDTSFQPYLISEILTNPDRVTHTKKQVTFWGKNPLPVLTFSYYSL